jgi:hypothetical protein
MGENPREFRRFLRFGSPVRFSGFFWSFWFFWFFHFLRVSLSPW